MLGILFVFISEYQTEYSFFVTSSHTNRGFVDITYYGFSSINGGQLSSMGNFGAIHMMQILVGAHGENCFVVPVSESVFRVSLGKDTHGMRYPMAENQF
jgi:hypothetical protein